MTGILSRYLSGTGTDPLNQQGGMEGYLSQYNVNPFWQQYLQGGQPSGLLGTLAQQQYTQGGQNPYAQGQNTYQQQAPAAPAATGAVTPATKIASFVGQPRIGQTAGDHLTVHGNARQGAGLPSGIVLDNGQTVSWDEFMKAGGMDGKAAINVGDDISALYSKLFGGK